jgi:SSS family solute:Na+ symporter
MISFQPIDVLVVVALFVVSWLIGSTTKKRSDDADDYLLGGRDLGVGLFVATNVATWYGGILGVGEFAWRYGLASWFTQGAPYYIFAAVFAFAFAKKVRDSKLVTVPDQLRKAYGERAALVAAPLIFVLTSPAPYALMIGAILSEVFGVPLAWGVLAGVVPPAIYLYAGGYRANVRADVFLFATMFVGFGIAAYVLYADYGGIDFLAARVPATHFEAAGGASTSYIVVWYFIALWTFADPGFHQRTYSARSASVAKWGILISIGFWALFDFLTNATGLYARALLPELENPAFAFPRLAEIALPTGVKGLFFAALFATVLSTLNSFLFLSASTFGVDILGAAAGKERDRRARRYTAYGVPISAALAVGLALAIPSVVDLWYYVGSACVPGLILLVVGAHYERLRVSERTAIVEAIGASLAAVAWMIAKPHVASESWLAGVEPMIAGLAVGAGVHLWGTVVARTDRVTPTR